MPSISLFQQDAETGREARDMDHGGIMQRLLSLKEAVQGAEFDAGRISEALRLLSQELREHFRREEAWLEDMKYPGMGSHRRQHEHLASLIAVLSDSFAEHAARENAERIFETLNEALLDHESRADAVIDSYLYARRMFA